MYTIPIWAIFGLIIIFLILVISTHYIDTNIEYVYVPDYTARTCEPEYEQKIPFKMHQTFTCNELPSTMAARIQAWLKTNPEYDHYYYTNNACKKYIQTHFEPDVYDAYNMLIPGAAKADLFRYCVLYQEGGVYADIAMKPLQPLKQIISPQDDAVLVLDVSRHAQDQNIYNAFICITPKHSLMKACIDKVVHNVMNRTHTNIFYVTGPTLFSQVYADDKTVLPLSQWRYQHQQDNNWGHVHFYQHRPGYVANIIETKYRLYNRDRKMLAGPHYGQLNRQGYMLKRKVTFDTLPIHVNKSINNDIPAHIMQTWKEPYVTDNMHAAITSWRQHNKHFTYGFFSDDSCEQDIKTYCQLINNESCLLAYNSLNAGAFKADLWRLVTLYLRGGFYVDIDMVCKHDLTYLQSYDLVLCRDLNKSRFYNAFIACKPGLTIIKQCIDKVVDNVLYKKYSLGQLDLTGPGAFTGVLRQLDCFGSGCLPVGTFHTTYDNVGLKINVLTYTHSHVKDTTNNTRIANVKYSNYDSERLILGGNDYASLWRTRKVFK